MLIGVFRALMIAMLVLAAAMFVTMLLKAAFFALFSLIVFLTPFVFVFWLVSHLHPGRHRMRVGGPWDVARHGPKLRWARRFARREDESKRWVREAEGHAREIARLVRRCSRTTREALAGSPESARKLADRVRELARLHQTLDTHLRGTEALRYRLQAREMEARAAAAADAFAAEQYRAAAQSLESQALTCEELARTRERLQAEVARILAALASLRARLVSMLAGPAAADGATTAAADELAHLEAQVDTFRDSVRQVLQQASHTAP